MKLNWKALALAPLIAPAIVSLLFIGPPKSIKEVLASLVLYVIGAVISYAGTLGLLVPSLYCLSKLTPLRFYKVCILGFFLGMWVALPITWIMWKSSGPDSGPPEEAYIVYLCRSWNDPVLWFLPISGLVTAAAHCFLPRWFTRRPCLPSVADVKPA